MNDVKKLLEDHKNLILSEARKHATNLPVEAVQVEAFKIAHEAAKNYDSAQGKFSTHLTHSLKKLSRFSTQYGQVVRMPENQQYMLNKVNKATRDLEAELGREPTLEELSDKTQLSIANISNVLENKKAVVSLSNLVDSPTFVDNKNDEWIYFVHHDLAPRDKLILEHRTGFGGKSVLDNSTLSNQLGISQSTLNTRIKFIENKLSEGWKE